MGIWLSRPGINVMTATQEDDFLLSTDYKNAQVFLAGSIYVSAGASETVYFPEVIDNPPYVSFNDSVDGGVNYYPFKIDVVPSAQRNYLVGCHSYTDRVVFANATEFGLVFFYRVLAKALGS